VIDGQDAAPQGLSNNVIASGTLGGSGSGLQEVAGDGRSAQAARRQPPPSPLSAAETDRSARLAAVNSYVYSVPPEELEAKLAAAGLSLLAQGRNQFTRWFVAEGRLPRVLLVRQPSMDEVAEGSAEDEEERAAFSGMDLELRLEPAGSSEQQPVERFVFVRGVVWRDPEVDLRVLWQVQTPPSPHLPPAPLPTAPVPSP